MRLWDNDRSEEVRDVIALLTRKEAEQLISYIQQLLDSPYRPGDHNHLSAEDYQRELTVSIYEPDNIVGFHPDMIKLIQTD